MPAYASSSSEPSHSNLEVYSHSNLEVVGGPQHFPAEVEARKDNIHQNIGAYGSQYPHQDAPAPHRTWRDWIFPGTIAALVSAAIVGGVVGGGLGSSLARCQTSLSQASLSGSPATAGGVSTTNSTTVTTTTGGLIVDYTAEPTSSIYSIKEDCASLEQAVQITRQNEKFSVYCEVDLGSGDGRQDLSGNDVVLSDIVGIVAYTLSDCLQACSMYTAMAQRWKLDGACESVTLNTIMEPNIEKNGDNY